MIKKILKLSLGLAVLISMFQTSFSAVISAETDNLALHKTVTYSGVEGGKKGDGTWTYPKFVGEMAVDGITQDVNKRWSAENIKAGPEAYEQWLEVDLGKEYSIGDIVVDFHAETTAYEIMISKDGKTYTSIANISDGSRGNTVSKTFSAQGKSARYVKYVQHKQWLHATNGSYYGSSIYELEVYEHDDMAIKDDTLRVGTFNIAAGKKPDVDAQRNLSDLYNLEIVGLQEVDVNTGRNNYDMLEKFASNNYTASYFSKAIDFSGGQYGIGSASRYALDDTSTTYVDTTGADEARVFQRSVITKNGKKIAFYNLHLSWETPKIREKQFAQLKAALAADPIEYKIAVGDFNADQYYSEFYTFLEDMDMANGYDGIWHETYNGVDNTMKHNCIDNILVSRNLKINNVQNVKTTLSDHNLFWAEVEFLDEDAVSYQWLKAMINEYETVDTKAFTETSTKAFEKALEDAKTGVNTLTTQEQVNTATEALIKAYNDLETFNLAYKKGVTYSGVEGDKNTDGTWKYPQFVGENVVDGSMSTRWSGNKIDEAWLTVDLGEVKDISEVLIHFESAAPKYQILVSENGSDWTKVYEEMNGEHGVDGVVQASFTMTKARYVKYQQLERWLHSNKQLYSTSFYEMEVYKEFLIEEITLPSTSDVISIGDEIALKPEITPTLAQHKAVTYVSDNELVAKVDTDGTITGVGAGTATITVKSAVDDNVFATFEVEIVDGPVKVSKLVFDEEELNLTPRDKRFVEYSVYPSKAIDADLEVTYSSDDENVAVVNKDGLVECVGLGKAVITVASKENPEIKATLDVNVEQPTYNPDYDTMQDRWLRRVVGDDTLDLNDPDVAAYIKNVSDEAQELWDSMHKESDRTTLWDMSDSTVAADYTTQFTKIKKLTLAFGTKGSALYQNKALYNDILSALDFMVVNRKYNGVYYTGNWWDWQIGCTHQLVDTLIILKDYSEYTDIEAAVKSVEGYAKDPAIQWPSYTASGANRTDIGLAVLGSAIVARNDSRMNLVLTKVPDVMKLVTKGDGLYADGSVIQHTAHAYTGSYGNELMKGIGKIQSITAGTDWEIKDARIENVYNTAVEGYIPLMERGRMMAMVNGRSISRAPGTNPFTTELASGSETISNLMLISQFAPEKYSSQIDEAIKYWLQGSAEEYDFFENARDIESLLNAKALLNDNNIEAKRYTGMKVYGSMDRITQSKDTYAVGLSMYSSRINNYEYGNTENPRGWHTADGALYLYTNDFKQYGEGYWTAIDSLRLAGTTTDTRSRNNGSDQSEKSAQSLVGGVSDGINGTGAMFLNKGHVTNMNLKAKKSWFFLGDKIVAVGSDIDGTTTDTIETTIENRVISDDSKISVNGTKWTNAKETLNLGEGSYVHYDEASTNTQIGYYFPTAQDVKALVEERTGKYSDINNYFVNDKTYTMDFFSLGINHGSTSVDGKYEYVLFPDASEASLAAYAKDNDLEIINNENVHAISEGNVFALNTFADNIEVNGFKVSAPACIYTETVDGVMTISISNPKQNAISLKLELTDGYKSLVSKSDKVTQNGDETFSINTSGAAGKTFTIVVELNVDRSELDEKIAEAEAIIDDDKEDTMTSSSWDAFKDAYETAVNLDVDASASEVKEAVKALDEAIKNLEPRASKEAVDALETLIDTCKAMEDDFTEADFADMKALIEESETLLAKGREDLSSSEVSKAIEDLLDAKKVLEANKAETNSLLDTLEIHVEIAQDILDGDISSYRPGKVKELEKAVAEGKALVDANSKDKAAIIAATDKIADAMSQLWDIVDKSELTSLIIIAEKYAEADYSAESWAKLETALAAAKTVVANDDATEAQVAKAYKDLFDAINGLERKINTEALEREIAAVEKILENKAKYVASSIKGLPAALESAKKVLANGKTQAEIDAATKALTKEKLKARLKADTSALSKMVTKANNLEVKGYTANSVDTLNAAIKEAQAVLNNEEVTQEEVKAAELKLQKAMNGLKKVSSPSKAATSAKGVASGDTTDVNTLVSLMALAGIAMYGTYRRKKYIRK
ncbi:MULTISPECIES: polysaccharide lyase family 8 super-sandwich domain-containing protein [unclassified Breznakia]|uniref:polysaccharide lyase family 8 super-sandwich domain-containing protein n=1 Tax=unclassified Breznakia TaxID=2623764 RepID=UPI002406B5F2|nr:MULTISPECIES: polysaccharide lyase family 8 super-sandwich domain-containing protein [unclassified Breznakia]MDF9837555.1 endonuclease/exonuclease/phosphatase family metal-dependent hydrolase [Breznakia sp. PFB2-8]MDF9860553.1 endonuclease/exonuclease/phosphatase family metal-dependent hydrolase [Breznakia sp. PH5-24]